MFQSASSNGRPLSVSQRRYDRQLIDRLFYEHPDAHHSLAAVAARYLKTSKTVKAGYRPGWIKA